MNSTNEEEWYVVPSFDPDADLNDKPYELTIGFILDGVDDFKDISKSNSSELRALAEEFDVIDPPIIEEWTEEILYDPKSPNATITIKVSGSEG